MPQIPSDKLWGLHWIVDGISRIALPVLKSLTQSNPHLGPLLFQWHFGGSVHNCTHPFPGSMGFYSFLKRILTKPYLAIPYSPPFLHLNFGSGILDCEKLPGLKFKDLADLSRIMWSHWKLCHRKPSSPIFLVLCFPPFPRTNRLFSEPPLKLGLQFQLFTFCLNLHFSLLTTAILFLDLLWFFFF